MIHTRYGGEYSETGYADFQATDWVSSSVKVRRNLLAIYHCLCSAEITEMLDGRIEVRSQLGQGSGGYSLAVLADRSLPLLHPNADYCSSIATGVNGRGYFGDQ